MDTETKRPMIVVNSPSDTSWMDFDVDGVGALRIDPMTLTNDMQTRLMYHGLKQKVIDAAAIGLKQPDGSFKRPTARQKYDAMAAVIANLIAGQWNASRGDGVVDGGLLLEALVRMYAGKKDRESLQKWLESKDAKEKAKLRALPKVAMYLAAIRAERNPDAVDAAEDILADLES